MSSSPENSIAWEDTLTGDVNLLRLPIVNNKKIPFFTPSYGQLMAPPGWRKLSKNALSSAYLMYEINNLPETKPPILTGDEPQAIKDSILNTYYWSSPQYRLELFSSSDAGLTWVRRSKIPLMRPVGFPEGTVNLLATMNNVVLTFKSTDRLAVAFRDVGFGLPSQASDSLVVTTTQEIPQLIYQFASLQSKVTTVFERVTSTTPIAASTWYQLVAADPNRISSRFSVANSLAATVTTIRYGSTTDTTAATQVISRSGETIGQDGYTGIISYQVSSISPRPLVTATESFN